jgi:hypothetical protein
MRIPEFTFALDQRGFVCRCQGIERQRSVPCQPLAEPQEPNEWLDQRVPGSAKYRFSQALESR